MKISSSQSGFTLMEIMIAMVIIAIFGFSFSYIQTTSWGQTIFATRTLVAGHLIEKEIEGMRNTIAMAPLTNFPPTGSSYTKNGVTLNTVISKAYNPNNIEIDGLRKVELIATWVKNGSPDTLRVETYISRYF